jgi:16S rRNA processing protein RimM
MTERIVVLGKLGAPYGVKGWIHLTSYTQPESNVFGYQPWLIGRQGHWETAHVIEQAGTQKKWVIRLQGYENRGAASLLTHSQVGVYRNQLKSLSNKEFYWADLEGLKVVHYLSGCILGHVYSLKTMPTYDVLLVKKETSSSTEMIPLF